MVNITILFFTFIFLVNQSILLLNEESLILLCFIVFIVLSINNLTTSVNSSFKIQSTQIEKLLKISLKQVFNSLSKVAAFKISLNKILINFNILKSYYIELVDLLINFVPHYNKLILQNSYQKRLFFLNKVEIQTTKLLVIVLLKRLNKIIKLKKFYNQVIKTPQFLCLETISLRECIQLIKIK